MGALVNLDHERFCQAAHRRIWAGEKHVAAFEEAYRETILESGADPAAISANVRRLRNQPRVKARMQELAEYAAKLAGIDAGWAQLKLRAMVEASMDSYLTPVDAQGNRYFNIGQVPAEALAQLVELHQEETAEEHGLLRVRKTRIKLPDKIAALGLMAKIAGWIVPEKTNISVGLSLEQLVMQAVDLRKQQEEPQL